MSPRISHRPTSLGSQTGAWGSWEGSRDAGFIKACQTSRELGGSGQCRTHTRQACLGFSTVSSGRSYNPTVIRNLKNSLPHTDLQVRPDPWLYHRQVRVNQVHDRVGSWETWSPVHESAYTTHVTHVTGVGFWGDLRVTVFTMTVYRFGSLPYSSTDIVCNKIWRVSKT